MGSGAVDGRARNCVGGGAVDGGLARFMDMVAHLMGEWCGFMGDVEVDVWTRGEIDETAALRVVQPIRSGGLHLAQTSGCQKH